MSVKIQHTVSPGTVITVEGATASEAMIELAPFVDGYEKIRNAGEDPAEYVPHGKKTHQGYEFYTLRRKDGMKEMQFGQTKEGNHLFPKGVEDTYEAKQGGQQQGSAGQDGW